MPIKPAAPVTRTFIGLPVLGLPQLDQLHVLHVAIHAADRDVQEARQAVEEAQAHDVELEEADHGREEEVHEGDVTTFLECLARGERGVAVLALEIGGEVVVGLVHQVALERAGRHREQHLLVHEVVAPARAQAVEKARAPVGVALAVGEPAAEEAVAPSHAVHRRRRRGERALDRLRELGRDALVGVEAQHPVVARLLDRELLLAAEAEPFLLHYARALALRELRSAIARRRIDDHDLVDEREAVEAWLEDRGGVARDEDGREWRSWRAAAQLGYSLRINMPYFSQ